MSDTRLAYPRCALTLPDPWFDTTVVTLARRADEGSSYLANVRIEIGPIPPEATARDCAARELAVLQRAPIKGLSVLRDEDVELGARHAALLEFTYYQDPPKQLGLAEKTVKFRQRVYIVASGGQAARLICIDFDAAFEAHREEFERIAGSFWLTDTDR